MATQLAAKKFMRQHLLTMEDMASRFNLDEHQFALWMNGLLNGMDDYVSGQSNHRPLLTSNDVNWHLIEEEINDLALASEQIRAELIAQMVELRQNLGDRSLFPEDYRFISDFTLDILDKAPKPDLPEIILNQEEENDIRRLLA